MRKKSLSGQSAASRKAFAIIFVLLILALIMAFVVSFFVIVSSELVSSKSGAAASDALRLSDLSVQVVMSQIESATQDGKGAYGWASQPGAIRTFDSSGANYQIPTQSPLLGNTVNVFKLYSDSNMRYNVKNKGPYDPASDQAPANWDLQPELYTDLNEASQGYFPILDPNVILTHLVDGVDVDLNAIPISGSYGTNGAPKYGPQSLPMPVKWLYVLKDNEIVAPDALGAGQGALKFSSAKNPLGVLCTVNGVTFTNEIVGRIAFWTDDETCKLNLNTASEGIPWEQPYYARADEVAWAAYQPAAFEFNRIPGHPATTSLSPVFWQLFGLTDPNYCLWPLPTIVTMMNAQSGDPKPQIPTLGQNYLGAILGLSNYSPAVAPRSVTYDTGSKCGTFATGIDITSSGLFGPTLTVNRNRLYADVDELQFSAPSPQDSSYNPNYTRKGKYNGFFLTNSHVSRLRFFLTTESQAPEVNLFHQPRVSIWPVPDIDANHVNPLKAALKLSFNINQRTTLDKLMANCASLGKDSTGAPYPYFFTRYDPTSPTNDYSTIPRNIALYTYLRNFMDKAVPGFGAAYSSRADLGAAATDQLMTEVFDYIRSCVNLCDSSMGTGVPKGDASANQPYSGSESTWLTGCYTSPPFFQPTANGSPFVAPAQGTAQVAPISITTPNNIKTKGIGRFPVLRDVSLMFYADYADQPPVYVDSFRRPGILSGNTITALYNSQAYKDALVAANENPLNPTQLDHMSQNPPKPLTGSSAKDKSAQDIPLTDVQTQILVQMATINPMHPFVMFNDKNQGPNLYTAGTPRISTSGSFPNNKLNSTGPGLSGKGSYLNSEEYPTTNFKLDASTGTGSGTSHPGMPYIPVVNPATGAFDMTNDNYKGPAIGSSNAPGLFQTTVEAGAIVDLCNPVVGSPGMGMSCQVTTAVTDPTGTNGFSLDGRILNISGGAAGISQNFLSTSTANKDYTQSMLFFNTGKSAPLSVDANGNYPGTINVGTSNPNEPNGSTFQFGGSQVKVTLKCITPNNPVLLTTPPVQTYTIYFPRTGNSNFFPTPKLATYSVLHNPLLSLPTPNVYQTGVPDSKIVYLQDSIQLGSAHTLLEDGSIAKEYFRLKNVYDFIPSATFRMMEACYGDVRTAACYQNLVDTNSTGTTQNLFLPGSTYFKSKAIDSFGNVVYLRGGTSFRGNTTNSLGSQDSGTVLRSLNDMVLAPGATTVNTRPRYDIYRLRTEKSISALLGNKNVPDGLENYESSGAGSANPVLVTTADMGDTAGFYNQVWAKQSDFDNGVNCSGLEGPFINKPDEGSVGVSTVNWNPYYAPFTAFLDGANLFSPIRQIPSAVMFGSLPVGIDPTQQNITHAWKTLQFSPNPNLSIAAYNAASNRATNPPTPPDYLLLDLFQMPVVQPYAISGPLYTSGKVNLNYQIAPFTYITRNTALRGVFKNTPITAADDQNINNSIGIFTTGIPVIPGSFQYPIHLGETLKQFDYRFNTQKDLFHSATEICSLWLYPATQPVSGSETNPGTALVPWDAANANIMAWWYKDPGKTRKGETGDNMRERPYAELYPRLTTQSNSYTVHFRVQVLKQAQGTDKTTWLEPNVAGAAGVRDAILSEYRGSSLIERYIDPNDTTLPDFATAPGNTDNVDKYYKFRVVSTRRFAP